MEVSCRHFLSTSNTSSVDLTTCSLDMLTNLIAFTYKSIMNRFTHASDKREASGNRYLPVKGKSKQTVPIFFNIFTLKMLRFRGRAESSILTSWSWANV